MYGGDGAESFYPGTFRADHSSWLESALWYFYDYVTGPAMVLALPAGVSWVAVDAGQQPIAEQPPSDFYVGGYEYAPGYRPLGMCKAWYGGGEHPGKLVGNLCSFGWGGLEQIVPLYRVLEVSAAIGTWASAPGGSVPPNGFASGYENGHALYACRASYGSGVHPGKVVGTTCNIGWGGQEVPLPNFEVLCFPSTCASLGASCGPVSDGCGGTLDCGGCPAGEACGADGTPNTCGVACVPHFHCRPGMCGTFDDGCGNDICCGTATRCCY